MTNHLMRGHSSQQADCLDVLGESIEYFVPVARTQESFHWEMILLANLSEHFPLRPHRHPGPSSTRPKRSAYGVAGLRSVRGRAISQSKLDRKGVLGTRKWSCHRTQELARSSARENEWQKRAAY